MRARATLDAKVVRRIDLTISLTMTVDEWHQLMRQTSAVWPSSEIGRAIASALGHVTRMSEAEFVGE